MTQPALLGPLSEETPAAATGPCLLALDLSLTATGWAKRTPEGFIRSGVLHPPPTPGLPRVHWIREIVRSTAREADLVVIEGLAYAAKGNAALEIAGLAMVIRLSFHDLGKRFVDVSPSCLKKFATGKGNAKKEDMLAAAIRRLDYQGSDHNEADALWLLQMGLHHYGCPGAVSLPAGHLESLSKVKWPQLKRRAA